MKLTLKTDYALRTLLYLAQRPMELASIADVASHYQISENHLVKVVHELGRKGYIETVRGKGGGIRIAAKVWNASVGEIVRAMEEDFAIVECFKTAQAKETGTQSPKQAPRASASLEFAHPSPCLLAGNCELQNLLAQALRAFLNELDNYPFQNLLSAPDAAKLFKGIAVTAA